MEHSPTTYEEIGFADLWVTVKRRRAFIASVTLLFTLAALLYVYLAPNVYEAKAVILPPQQSDLDRMNVIPEQYVIKLDEVYRNVVVNLRSNSLRHDFFVQNHLYDALKGPQESRPEFDVFEDDFNKQFAVEESEVKGDQLPVVSITLAGRDPAKLAQWLNGFINFVDQFTVQSILTNIGTKISMLTKNLQDEINWKVRTAEKERLDAITRTEEAAAIAKKLGLEKQADVPYYSYNQAIQAGDKGEMVLNQHSTPEYLKGYKALAAEADALKGRRSDESYIPDLRKLQEEIQYYESIKAKLEPGHSLRLDQVAQIPRKPAKPKKILLVVLGFCTGLVAAVALVVLQAMVLDAGRDSRGRIAQ